MVHTFGLGATRPVSWDGVAHPDFHNLGDYIVDTQTAQKEVDHENFGAIRSEDASQDGEESDFDQQGHGTVKDGGDIAELRDRGQKSEVGEAQFNIPCGKGLGVQSKHHQCGTLPRIFQLNAASVDCSAMGSEGLTYNRDGTVSHEQNLIRC